jgi:transcriptional regulator with XRE-family HTH domain
MSKALTDYEIFTQSSVQNRRLLQEEELILDVTESLSRLLEEVGLSKTELARRLGKTKGFVSQILAGGRNLTLRTIADVADALDYRIHIEFSNQKEEQLESTNPIEEPRMISVSAPPTLSWGRSSEWQNPTIAETIRRILPIAA